MFINIKKNLEFIRVIFFFFFFLAKPLYITAHTQKIIPLKIHKKKIHKEQKNIH